MKAGIAATIGASTYTTLSAPLDDDVFLQHQLDAVGERLEHAPGAVPVGADAQLHPGHDLALPDDREQHGQHQEGEAEDRLDDDQPPRVVPEHRQILGGERSAVTGSPPGGTLRGPTLSLTSALTRPPPPVRRAVARHARPCRGRLGSAGTGRGRDPHELTGPAPVSADAPADGVQRQPDHPVGHRRDPQRQPDGAGRAGDRDQVAVLGARPPRRWPRRAGRPPRAGCRPAPRRPPAAGPGRAAAGGRRAPPRPRSGRGSVRGAAPSGRRRPGRRSTPASRSSSARAERTSGRPQVDVEGVGEHVQHPGVGQQVPARSSGRA